MGASIIARVDLPPVLELAEHVLDFVALAVENFVVRHRDFLVRSRRNIGGDAACPQ